jgi:AraC-like DNA-binding protein
MHDDLIFLASSHIPATNQLIDKHLIGYATMQYMQHGGVFLAYNDRDYQLEGAWFWPAYPGPRIKFHAAPGYPSWSHRHIGFQGALFHRWVAQGIWPNGPQPAPVSRTPEEWAEWFDAMNALSRRADRWGRLRAINLLEQLLLELAEARTVGTERDAWLEEVLQKLHLDEPTAAWPNYEELANELGVGVATLRRKFKAITETSLYSYVMQSRIAHARTLLSETDLPLKTIAARLGYNNVYFFSRQFREIAGVSPGTYRKSRH